MSPLLWVHPAITAHRQIIADNQSGPLHYDPEDISGATMNNGNADGADKIN